MQQSEVLVLRRKILGVLIREARLKAGMDLPQVGTILDVPADLIGQIELAQADVSLPQLEALALLFRVPLSYFWSDEPLETSGPETSLAEAIGLRRRIIGALLRQARSEANRSEEEVAQFLGKSPDRIAAYELGQQDVPVMELEAVAEFLNVSLDFFLEEAIAPSRSSNGQARSPSADQLPALPADIREFVLDPANELYLRLAMRLGNLSASTLRQLAEGILDITY
jgi:transcriptional regulator with XRE-family HTH domain